VQGWERQKQQHDLKGRGMDAGIPYFNLDRWTSNTMASHRLIQHVGKKYGLRVSEGLYDVLNVYYFVDGFALNDRPRLAKTAYDCIRSLAAEEEGSEDVDVMSEEEILDFLNSDEGRREIEEALSALQQMGVHGIPKFVIEGSRLVDGAAHSDVFIDIFRDIEERGEVLRGPIFADILGVSPEILLKGSHTRATL
jgi:predicted DsbA family dithiol-disulfide isomerase